MARQGPQLQSYNWHATEVRTNHVPPPAGFGGTVRGSTSSADSLIAYLEKEKSEGK